MRVKTILLLSFLFAACTLSTINNKKSERELILTYKIKSIKEYMTVVHFGIEEKEKLHRVKLYNEKGLLTKETVFREDTGIDYIATYEYDTNGNLKLTQETDPDGRLVFKIMQSFDEKNNLKDFRRYVRPNGPYIIGNTNKYDSKGRKIETDWFNPSGPLAIEKYTYDGMKMIEDVQNDMQGKLEFRWIDKYDESVNLIEAVQYYPGGLINLKMDYDYNKENEMLKETTYIRGTILQYLATFNYDAKHLLVAKTEYSSPGKISAKYRYEYEFK